MVDRGRLDPSRDLGIVDPKLCQPPNEKMELLPSDFEPGYWDVICQGGRESYDHIGNRRFRICIGNHLETYMAAKSKHKKSMVVTVVVDTVRDSSTQSDGCGFVRKDAATNRWYEVGDKIAREKVGHALRDAIKLRDKKQQNQKNELSAKKPPPPAAANTKKRKRPSSVISGAECGLGTTSKQKNGKDGKRKVAPSAGIILSSEATEENNCVPQSEEPVGANVADSIEDTSTKVPPNSIVTDKEWGTRNDTRNTGTLSKIRHIEEVSTVTEPSPRIDPGNDNVHVVVNNNNDGGDDGDDVVVDDNDSVNSEDSILNMALQTVAPDTEEVSENDYQQSLEQSIVRVAAESLSSSDDFDSRDGIEDAKIGITDTDDDTTVVGIWQPPGVGLGCDITGSVQAQSKPRDAASMETEFDAFMKHFGPTPILEPRLLPPRPVKKFKAASGNSIDSSSSKNGKATWAGFDDILKNFGPTPIRTKTVSSSSKSPAGNVKKGWAPPGNCKAETAFGAIMGTTAAKGIDNPSAASTMARPTPQSVYPFPMTSEKTVYDGLAWSKQLVSCGGKTPMPTPTFMGSLPPPSVSAFSQGIVQQNEDTTHSGENNEMMHQGYSSSRNLGPRTPYFNPKSPFGMYNPTAKAAANGSRNKIGNTPAVISDLL